MIKSVLKYIGKSIVNILLTMLLVELVERAVDKILPWDE